MNVREITIDDMTLWSTFRTALWPDTDDNHLQEIREFFDGKSVDVEQVFMVENANGEAVGFLELNIREFAEGSCRPRVPYVEACYIAEGFRGQGYGKMLMKAAEKWTREKGFSELASDTETSNLKSIAIHKQLGFKETERVVCFLKQL